MLPHPLPVITAMILLALLSLTNLVPAQTVIYKGSPTVAVFLPIVAGVLGLVGAWGLWMLKRWAMWLVIVVCVLDTIGIGSPTTEFDDFLPKAQKVLDSVKWTTS